MNISCRSKHYILIGLLYC